MEKVSEARKKASAQLSEPFFRSSSGAATNASFFSRASTNMSNTIQRIPNIADGTKTGNDENTNAPSADLAEPKEKSKLRDALSVLFTEYEGTHVGDKKFDDIETQKAWDATKKEEEDAKAIYKINKANYDEAKAKYDADTAAHRNAGTRPIPPAPVAVFTTCIAAQSTLLKKAFAASGLNIQKVGNYSNNLKLNPNAKKSKTYGYGTTGQAQATALNAFHTATINDPARPERSDIIILANRGSSVDKAAATVRYLKDTFVTPNQKKSAIAEKALAVKENALTDANAALNALMAASATNGSAEMLLATHQVKKANESFKPAKKAADDTEIALQTGEAKVEEAENNVDAIRGKADHKKTFEFSHVGFIESITPNGNGTETWQTFDGGQTLDTAEGKKQGAKSNKRIYDPRTNEIAGEASQGGLVRWLQGWVNVTKLVEPSAETPAAAE